MGLPWYAFIRQRGTAGRTPSIFDVNFRVTYDLSGIMRTRFKPRLVLDIFHLTSRRTPVAFDQVHFSGLDPDTGEQAYPNPMYGHATGFFPPISARLGFEVGF